MTATRVILYDMSTTVGLALTAFAFAMLWLSITLAMNPKGMNR